MTKMKERKADHIDIAMNEKVSQEYCYWDDIKLIHEALPEIDPEDIDTRVNVLGRKLEFPMIITAITGGFTGAERINGNIAKACSELGIGMGVGSQRAAIEGIDEKSYAVVKEYDVPLVIGNVGAPQLVSQHGKRSFGKGDIEKAMDLIDADAVAIHLNFLQEVVQPEGDTRSKGCFDAIRDISRDIPVMIKETGAGISRSTAERLKGIGIKAIDVAGMGGTSFSAVELYRAESAKDEVRARLGRTFFDWGIPATVSTIEANVGIPIIASGGIMNGLHAANSIALGASCAGAANLFLKEAMDSSDAVKRKLIMIREELRAAMLLTGSKNIKELQRTEYVITGKTKEWMGQQ